VIGERRQIGSLNLRLPEGEGVEDGHPESIRRYFERSCSIRKPDCSAIEARDPIRKPRADEKGATSDFWNSLLSRRKLQVAPEL
jgi:hypothetical protein